MSKTLDEKIFEGFIQVVDSKKILSNETLKDLKKFVNKLKVIIARLFSARDRWYKKNQAVCSIIITRRRLCPA